MNWAVKPFSMALLGWLFMGWLFKPLLPAEQSTYIAGLILLAAAPCTAMVFVWSQLTKGEPHFTLWQVRSTTSSWSLRLRRLWDSSWDYLRLPCHGKRCCCPSRSTSWSRSSSHNRSPDPGRAAVARLTRLLSTLQPVSLVALLATLVLLFGFQGEQILAQPLIIAMLAVPILIQVYFNSGLAYLLNRATGEAHCVAAPSALIGASNFFELAVAAAISLFGFNSGAALATVVGVLIEVPVMLSVVKIVNETSGWYDAGTQVRRRIAREKLVG